MKLSEQALDKAAELREANKDRLVRSDRDNDDLKMAIDLYEQAGAVLRVAEAAELRFKS